MADHREALIEAGLEILREEGLAGFAQAKVAARAGLRQGHLTYYFPTRTDLLAAVARKAIDNQLAALAGMVAAVTANGSDARDAAIQAVAAATQNHRNTRVLVALNQAADQEPVLRALFNEMTDGFVGRLGGLLDGLGLAASEDQVDLVHALFVGLSIIELATSRPRGRERSEAALAAAFTRLAAAPAAQRRAEEDRDA